MQQSYNYLAATGKLHYNMTNDYMFRMVLQRDKETLINLISSVLGIPRDEILDVKIENTVEPGKSVDNKEFQMDILVLLNDNTYINLEMQVLNYNNWPMRSLSYLCRRFDNVARGQDYSMVKPVYHIGFLDFTLFEDHPEFCGIYQIRNIKDNYQYTDKFNLYVIELNHTDLATKQDKANHINDWARLFKATTWEEIKMITKDNPSMNSAAESIYLSNADISILEQCRAREDAIAHEAHQKKVIADLKRDLNEANKRIEEKSKQLEDAGKTIAKDKEAIAEKDATIAQLQAKIEALENKK
ncbi:MAG: Rpn family recombination-promoting nuclease/putative transposase [Butyrivibrio sp.]|nr:Rpn family recombination-promoting nuclease/putative transposase [Butyrivibrio sp.]